MSSFTYGDIIEVRIPDLSEQEAVYRATYICDASETHVKIRIDDGLICVVAREFCAAIPFKNPDL